MSKTICSVDGCETKVRARGYCNPHYLRWKRHGDPEAGGPPRRYETDIAERIHATGWTVTEKGCWLWRGSITHYGYARLITRGKWWVVSRLVLELDGRPAPFEEALARHKCDNPRCVNPRHLEWGDSADNHRDMVERNRAVSFQADYWNGLCRNGLHDITLPGAIIRLSDKPRCAECYDAYKVRFNRRRRERRAAARKASQ